MTSILGTIFNAVLQRSATFYQWNTDPRTGPNEFASRGSTALAAQKSTGIRLQEFNKRASIVWSRCLLGGYVPKARREAFPVTINARPYARNKSVLSSWLARSPSPGSLHEQASHNACSNSNTTNNCYTHQTFFRNFVVDQASETRCL